MLYYYAEVVVVWIQTTTTSAFCFQAFSIIPKIFATQPEKAISVPKMLDQNMYGTMWTGSAHRQRSGPSRLRKHRRPYAGPEGISCRMGPGRKVKGNAFFCTRNTGHGRSEGNGYHQEGRRPFYSKRGWTDRPNARRSMSTGGTGGCL